MNLHSLIIDDFLPHFDDWRAWADTANYGDLVNPVDGVSYPGICNAVPTFGTRKLLESVMAGRVTINALFTRLSLDGTPVPHWAHNDASMGHYSLMVYLNRPEHCQGGTALLRHRESQELAVAQADSNNPDRWEIYSTCEMKTNRAFIFRSELMHAALPIGGFGDTPANGRLVLTAFFSI